MGEGCCPKCQWRVDFRERQLLRRHQASRTDSRYEHRNETRTVRYLLITVGGRAAGSQRFAIRRIFISDPHLLQRAATDRAHWPAPTSGQPIAAHPAKFISRFSRASALQLAHDRFSYMLFCTVAACLLFILHHECRIGQQRIVNIYCIVSGVRVLYLTIVYS